MHHPLFFYSAAWNYGVMAGAPAAILDHKDEESILEMAQWKAEGSLSPYDHEAVTPALGLLTSKVLLFEK